MAGSGAAVNPSKARHTSRAAAQQIVPIKSGHDQGVGNLSVAHEVGKFNGWNEQDFSFFRRIEMSLEAFLDIAGQEGVAAVTLNRRIRVNGP